MKTFFKKINKNYGIELTFFNKIRSYSDGITFFNININLDRYEADHSPKFEFSLTILNVILIDMMIYYLHHR